MPPKKAKVIVETQADSPTTQRPRLKRLTIRNFRAIGAESVVVDLDDIVVLVGPNNSGKSSILRAYEVVMQHGSKEGELLQEDFPNSKVDGNPVEIELETVVYDEKAPGERWIHKNAETGEMTVREKWSWSQPGRPKRVGWEVSKNNWHDEVPWGAPGVAQPARPEPHRIQAFDPPEKQAEAIIKLLKDVLNERIKGLKSPSDAPSHPEDDGASHYQQLLGSISEFQKKVVEDANEQITKVENDLNSLVGKVFPGHVVRFDARPESDLDSCLNFFKETPQLLMGPADGYQSAVERQGSGARRTLLWAALRLISEQVRAKKDANPTRPHLLLMDEPELCLHPDAIREACKVLYDLPKSGNWQVMVTTHSPVFIDLSRDNTSIVRVERKPDGHATGTTIYRPAKARLSNDEKECLKLLNVCDPYVAEFFFGGRTVVVEGDTEYTAFKYILDLQPDKFKNIHIVRARGKAPIKSLCKILNQFNSAYSVLHDSDSPTTKRDGKDIANPAWTLNSEILSTIKEGAGPARVLASVPNFEVAYFGVEAKNEKPTTAWARLKADNVIADRISGLLQALIDEKSPVPDGATTWVDIEQLKRIHDSKLKGSPS